MIILYYLNFSDIAQYYYSVRQTYNYSYIQCIPEIYALNLYVVKHEVKHLHLLWPGTSCRSALKWPPSMNARIHYKHVLSGCFIFSTILDVVFSLLALKPCCLGHRIESMFLIENLQWPFWLTSSFHTCFQLVTHVYLQPCWSNIHTVKKPRVFLITGME